MTAAPGYAWFGDNLGLFDAVIRRNAGRVRVALNGHLDGDTPVEAALSEFGRALAVCRTEVWGKGYGKEERRRERKGEGVVLWLWEVRTGKRVEFSGGLQGEDPFHVPGEGDEVPFSLDLVEAAQVELPEAQHRFDDAEHGFRRLLA